MKVRATKSAILDISEAMCGHVQSPQYVLLTKGTLECTIHNVASELWPQVCDGFATNKPHHSYRFLFFKLYKGRIKQRVLVANVATNFRILVASTENLGTLVTVSGAISCPAHSCPIQICNGSLPFPLIKWNKNS